jgi:hypothetical protein
MECLFIQESDGVTVQNSTFTNCSIMDVFISPIVSTQAPTNLTLRGNRFEQPTPEEGAGAVVVNPSPEARRAASSRTAIPGSTGSTSRTPAR